MNPIDAISALTSQNAAAILDAARPCQQAGEAQQATFAELLALGVRSVEAKVDHANEMVRAFAVDDAVPIHEVTIALEEARLAVELAMHVRSRLVEGYREIMNMQL